MKAAAKRRLGRERLQGDLAQLLAELELDAAEASPMELLSDAMNRASAMLRVLGELVGRLDVEKAGVFGGVWGPDHLGDLRSHPLMQLYAEWTTLSARTAKMALDAGVEERAVAVTEAQSALLAGAMRKFAELAGLDFNAPAIRAAFRTAIESVPKPATPVLGRVVELPPTGT